MDKDQACHEGGWLIMVCEVLVEVDGVRVEGMAGWMIRGCVERIER